MASTDDTQGIARRHGPDPAARFYKLDEQLLWDPDLRPLEKLVLIDFFHRERRGCPVPGIISRAPLFGVTRETLGLAEKALERRGFLIREQAVGRPLLYLAAYPAIPAPESGTGKSAERLAFEKDAEGFMQPLELSENPSGKLTENPSGSCRKIRQVLSENPSPSDSHTCMSDSKKKEEGKKATAIALSTALDPTIDLDLRAHRLYNTVLLPVATRYHNCDPTNRFGREYRDNIEVWIGMRQVPTPELCEAALIEAMTLWGEDPATRRQNLAVPIYPKWLIAALSSVLKAASDPSKPDPRRLGRRSPVRPEMKEHYSRIEESGQQRAAEAAARREAEEAMLNESESQRGKK